MADLIERRCTKPGCGALRRVGNPCYDWDCPQHTVSVEDYQSLNASLSQALARIEELEKANRLMRQPFIEQRMKPGVRWVITHLHDRASRMNHYPCKQWLNSLGYELGNRINDNRIDIAAAFESAATPIDGGKG